MKTLQLFMAVITMCLFHSCFYGENKTEEDQNSETNNEFEYSDDLSNNDLELQGSDSNNRSNETEKSSILQDGLTWFEARDKNTGLVTSSTPFPSNWQQQTHDPQVNFTGPNNLLISGSFGQSFFYGGQYSQFYGENNRPPMNLQQIIETFFMQTAQQTGRTLTTTFELPQIGSKMEQLRDNLWKFGNPRVSTKAYGIEWEDQQNMKYLTVLYITIEESQFGNSWAYFGNYLQASAGDYNMAKEAFLYGLRNTKVNPQWVMAVNQNEMQKADVSNKLHQQRMSAIRARGEAIVNQGKTYSDISDIIHEGYLSRSNMTDHGHSKSIRGINETTIISNHNTGEHYTVPMGNNHYWVASDGTYFGTDNPMFDPNTNNQTNNKDWTKFDIEQ